MLNVAALAAKAKEAGLDQTKIAAGGGSFEAPAEGPCMLRFVGYVEMGKRATTYQGKAKQVDEVQLTFEVHGTKYPVKEHEGKKYPVLVNFTMTLSQSEKAAWPLVFKALNYAGKASHAVELLGDAYKGRIYHKKYKRKTDPADAASWTGVEVTFRNPDTKAFSFAPAVREDEETGETTPLNVPTALTPIKAFLWNAPDMEQWASIYVPGEWAEKRDDKTGEVKYPAKSKNVTQLRIRAATNYGGSPVNLLLANQGQELDLDMTALDDEASEDSPSAAAKPEDDTAALSGVAKGKKERAVMDDIPF